MTPPDGAVLGRSIALDETGRHLVECEILAAVATAPDLDDALRGLLDAVATAGAWSSAQAWIVDPGASGLRLRAVWPLSPSAGVAWATGNRSRAFPRGLGVPGGAWKRGRPVDGSEPDAQRRDPRARTLRRIGVERWIAVPLMDRRGVVAVIELFGRGVPPPDDGIGTLLSIGRITAEALRCRSTEDGIRRSERRLHSILDSLGDSVVAINGQGVVVFANASIERLLGVAPDEIVGRIVTAILPVPHRRTGREHSRRYVLHGAAAIARHRSVAMTLRTAGGRPRIVDVSVTRGVAETDVAYSAIAREESPSHESELARAHRIERRLNRRLTRDNEERDTLLRAVAHELLDPVAAVRTLASLLKREGEELSGAERRAVAQRIDQAAAAIRQVIDEVIGAGRLEPGSVGPVRNATDLRALVERVIAASEHLEGRDVLVTGPSIVLAVDRWQVETIVANLVQNAARYSPAETPISVSIESHPRGVVLSVLDEGTGVPRPHRRSIFEPFHRGPDAAGPGHGIGLSLVDRFARLHGGRAWLEDGPNGGAAFHVLLVGPEGTS